MSTSCVNVRLFMYYTNLQYTLLTTHICGHELPHVRLARVQTQHTHSQDSRANTSIHPHNSAVTCAQEPPPRRRASTPALTATTPQTPGTAAPARDPQVLVPSMRRKRQRPFVDVCADLLMSPGRRYHAGCVPWVYCTPLCVLTCAGVSLS